MAEYKQVREREPFDQCGFQIRYGQMPIQIEHLIPDPDELTCRSADQVLGLGQQRADIIDYLPGRELMMTPSARNRVVPNARVVRGSGPSLPTCPSPSEG